MSKTLMKGNEALAEAAIRAGCKCYFGYPITPQNEIGAYMSERIRKNGGVFLQAESEIGAINMVYGCSATGTRCMTSSSSPGVSLKAEGISYLAGADLPCVIVNVQRGGPGLGTIQPSQADYWQTTRAMGHGDLRLPVLAPYSVQEMVDMTAEAFKIAEEFRTPVMLLADGLLGQMMEPVSFNEIGGENKDDGQSSPNWAASGHKNKREKNIITSLFLDPIELETAINERFERFEELRAKYTRSESTNTDDADIIVTAYGSTARVIQSAMEMAREEGIKVGTFRPITLSPFPEKALKEATKSAKKVLVVEMSMGQMVDDVKSALEYKLPVEFFGRQGGFVPGPQEILEVIRRMK
ncbi:MAG: 3-methyl-2-oxobutanoate dehydrogenase subunit VorB [Oscillospiraceae bacterium]|nr:3-methyl-2-oxobutanoate dehydrogenase subunit VorB [Oscillospiraceae bacterium]